MFNKFNGKLYTAKVNKQKCTKDLLKHLMQHKKITKRLKTNEEDGQMCSLPIDREKLETNYTRKL